jgi:hypothetical protein
MGISPIPQHDTPGLKQQFYGRKFVEAGVEHLQKKDERPWSEGVEFAI